MARIGVLFTGLVLALMAAFSAVPAQASPNTNLLFNPQNAWLNTARPVTTEDAKGRLVLLDFWTYGCINCMQLVPELKSLEKQFGDRLLVIGVHSAKFSGEQGSERILAAAKRFGITHPVINDSSFTVWKGFKAEAWPTLVLLGTDGVEISRYAGEGHRDELARDMTAALKSMTATPATALSGLKAKTTDTAVLSFPARLGFAPDSPWGEIIFVADTGHNRLLGFGLDGMVKVTIGSGKEGADDGDFAAASFNHPRGFAVFKDALYVADTGNHMLRRVDLTAHQVTKAAGTGARGQDRAAQNADPLTTALASPWDVKPLADGHRLAIAMAGLHQLWVLDTATHKISVLAGTGEEGLHDGPANKAALAQPSGLSMAGDRLFFADAESSSLRELDKAGNISTLVGAGLFDFGLVDGAYPKARLQHAQGLDADGIRPDGGGGRIVVADTYNNSLRIFDLSTKELSTLPLPKDALEEPGDVLQLNGKIFVADTNHNRIAVVDKEKMTVTELPLKITP